MDMYLGGTRSTDSTGLLLIDLDDFKEANTRFGHPGGEFAIVAHAVDVVGMRILAGRVLQAVGQASERLQEELAGVKVTASVGWAIYPYTASSAEDLMESADVSLRGVKSQGKNGALSPADRLIDRAGV
jgi:GGDEF domain-containing protein